MLLLCNDCCAGCSAPVFVPFNAKGCNSRNLAGAVVVMDDGAGHSYSGTTNSSGNVTLSVAFAGTYTVTVSKGRFFNNTFSKVVVCGTAPAVTNVTLSPASGYVCCSGTGCADPLPTTLFATLPTGGAAVTLTWSAADNAWVGAGSVASDRVFGGSGSPPVCQCPLTSGTIPFSVAVECGRRLGVVTTAAALNCSEGVTTYGYVGNSGPPSFTRNCSSAGGGNSGPYEPSDGGGLLPSPSGCDVPFNRSYTIPGSWGYAPSGLGVTADMPALFSGTATVTE